MLDHTRALCAWRQIGLGIDERLNELVVLCVANDLAQNSRHDRCVVVQTHLLVLLLAARGAIVANRCVYTNKYDKNSK